MLFPYTYVPQQMEKMHGFIDFIFFEVWCEAPGAGPFGLHLFDANPELKEVVTAFHYADTAGAHFFNGHVQRIHALFAALPPAHITQLQAWYRGNNDLAQACANNPALPLARYADIDALCPALGPQLASFFKGLYAPSLLGLKALRDKIGDIDNHYQAFMQANTTGKCPFCGLNDLLGEYHSKREAYDHYLPKALYPFNAINFHNLVPACHHCNSSYKGSQNPAHAPKDPCGQQARRKLFYPFAGQAWQIQLRIDLRPSTREKLEPDNVALSFDPPEQAEEIATWRDVYGIDERYRAKLCGAEAKAWIVAMEDEWRWHRETAGEDGKAPASYLRDLARHAARAPYVDSNFLKYPFLQARVAAGDFRQPSGASQPE